ncbi:unnamed protein product [Phytophthora lilii]|uniref:Unnamed protein product n=1 Tax=Phytophthora lilii TaxID=2077276 RepID=A0A9W6TFU7_9STRA|nr:unnamed protein product [Phytophthora lilii]
MATFGWMTTNPNWDEDSVGGLSSIRLLLRWLATEDNAARWLASGGKMDGSRTAIALEIHAFMVSHGIDYRSASSINNRLWVLTRQLQTAENWLARKGLRDYDANEEAKRTVLRFSPYYLETKSLLLHLKRRQPVAMRSPSLYDESSTEAELESETTDDDELRNVVLRKRGASRNSLPASKRTRTDFQSLNRGLKSNCCVALFEAEPEERREFFSIELQVKRDEAVLVRAKARKELLDLGVSLAEVDRLLPL